MSLRFWLASLKPAARSASSKRTPGSQSRKQRNVRLALETLEDRSLLSGTPLTAIPGTAGLWHLDEGTGLTTVDSGGPNPGTLANSPQWVTGNLSNALRFDGADDYVLLKNGPILGSAPNFTVEAWVKWDGGGTSHPHQFIYSEGHFNDIIDLYLANGVPGFTTLGANWETASAAAPLPVGEWHHLAGVLQAGVGGTLYVDGQPIATNPNMRPGSQFAGSTNIGRFAGNGSLRYFRGTIDEVRVLAVARSAAEIQADYLQGLNTVVPLVATGGFTFTATEGSLSASQSVATFTGPGNGALTSYSASVNWGDGSAASPGNISFSGGVYTVSGNHLYAEEGTYSIVTTVSYTDPLTSTAALNFDTVNAIAGPVNASSYLGSHGITLSAVTGGTSVSVVNNNSVYGGTAASPASAPNMLMQIGVNGPVSYTLNFATPLNSFGFPRPMLLAGPSGITHPQWSARAFNAAGQQVSAAAEGFISRFSNVPAASFTLTGPGISSVRFDSNGFNFAAFSAVLLDNLVLTGAAAPLSAQATSTAEVGHANEAPIARAFGPYTVNEGGTVTLDGSHSSDAEQASDSLTYLWDLDGDDLFGEMDLDALRGAEVGMFPLFSAAGLDGPSTYGIRLRVVDEEGLSNADTALINITNWAPMANLSSDGPVSLGSPVTVSFINPNDFSPADVTAGFHYAFALDAASLATATYENSGSDTSATFVFSDGLFDHTIYGLAAHAAASNRGRADRPDRGLALHGRQPGGTARGHDRVGRRLHFPRLDRERLHHAERRWQLQRLGQPHLQCCRNRADFQRRWSGRRGALQRDDRRGKPAQPAPQLRPHSGPGSR
jgi:hypothetical protein